LMLVANTNLLGGSVTVANAGVGVFATNVTGGVLDLAGDSMRDTAGNRLLGSGGLNVTNGTIWANGANRTITNALYLGGGTAVLGGRPDLGGNFTLNFAAPINGEMSGNNVIQVDNPNVVGNGLPQPMVTISGNFGTNTSGGALTKTGLGELVLTGTNQYTGATNISAGILDINNTNAVGNGPTVITQGSFSALYLDGSAAPLNFTNKVLTLNGGTGYLNNNLGDVINLAGNNSFTVPTVATPLAQNTFATVLSEGSTDYINTAAGSSLEFVGYIGNGQTLFKLGSGMLR